MRNLTRTVSTTLALTFAFGATCITGCEKKPFMSDEKLCKVAEDLKLEELDDVEDYIDAATSVLEEYEVYYTATGEDALKCYDEVVNYYFGLNFYHIASFTGYYMYDDDDKNDIWLITFEYDTDAQKFYEEFCEEDFCVSKEGEEKKYEYSIGSDEIEDSDLECWYGVYAIKDTNSVLVIRSVTEDPSFIKGVCEKLKIVSPTEA